jgi:hypothetical protein
MGLADFATASRYRSVIPKLNLTNAANLFFSCPEYFVVCKRVMSVECL